MRLVSQLSRTALLCMFAFAPTLVQAQEENGLFNHMAVGVSAGTDGIGFDLAMPATEHFGIRVGMSILPKIKASTDVDIDSNSSSFTTKEVNVEGKLNKTDFKVLLDYYPFTSNAFHITAGAYIGKSKIVSAYNTEQFLAQDEWGVSGVKLGDLRVTSDENGNVSADLKVNSFKPYLGIGYGRAVPHKRFGVMVDLGVQFWGKPGVYTMAKDDFGDSKYSRLSKDNFSGEGQNNKDGRDAMDIISKIKVYPVLSVRLCGRIF